MKQLVIMLAGIAVASTLVLCTPVPRTPFNGAWLLAVIVVVVAGFWASKYSPKSRKGGRR